MRSRSFLTLCALMVSLLGAPLIAQADTVNINTADATTLAKELKGIGAARANAIVTHRTQNGPFKSVDDLTLVKGISQKVIDENRDNMRVDGARAEAPARSAKASAKTDAAPRNEH